MPAMHTPRLALILAVLLILGGCAEERSCRERACSSDEKLVETVRTEMEKHTALMADNLHIAAVDGIVYVHGMVSTYVEYVEVDQLARVVPNARRFLNNTSIDNARY